MNPYPETIIDECSGVEVSNPSFHAYWYGFNDALDYMDGMIDLEPPVKDLIKFEHWVISRRLF